MSETGEDALPGGMQADLQRLRAAQQRDPFPGEGWRRRHLQALHAWIVQHREDISTAINADFGCRSRFETGLAELVPLVNALQHMQKHLHAWMRPEPRPVFWANQPASAEVVRQPKGVVGVIAPWNYPFQQAILPLATAICAGNRVMLKPSEITPATSELLRRAITEVFPAEDAAVVTGGPAVGAAFAALPFDHLLFTGSTAVGRRVAAAAAANLVPVTLELGGKSPAIVHGSYDLRAAVDRIMTGKLMNAGQICIAPDYVLLHGHRPEDFVALGREWAAKHYPRLLDNDDYTSIVSEHHVRRLQGLLDDAAAKGASVHAVNPAGEDMAAAAARRKVFPHFVTGLPPALPARIMEEEIFGPLLPILPVDSLEEAMARVNAGGRPLALYYFDGADARIQKVIQGVTAGGVTVNDTLMHIAQDDLPFGGVGSSGMGAYHGFDGFRTFSHEKPVFYQSSINGMGLLQPPYGRSLERILWWLIR